MRRHLPHLERCDTLLPRVALVGVAYQRTLDRLTAALPFSIQRNWISSRAAWRMQRKVRAHGKDGLG